MGGSFTGWRQERNHRRRHPSQAERSSVDQPGCRSRPCWRPRGNAAPVAKQQYYDQVLRNQQSDPMWGNMGSLPASQRYSIGANARGMTDYQIGQLGVGGQPSPFLGGAGRSGGGGYGRGGGGGGGGVDPALGAQAQMDYLNGLLNDGGWTVDASAYAAPSMDAARQANNALRGNVAQASAADLAAAQGSYNSLDSWLAANQTNPYSNVQMQDARVAPAQNAYLASQGISPMNEVAANPEDVGAKAAFQNVLSLLGAGQQSWNQSRGAESQQARAYAQNEIGAMDNAFLAQIGMRDADIGMQEAKAQMEMDQERRQAQMQLDQERRQLQVQLAELVGLGARAPGARPVFTKTKEDPLGWASIAAAQEWDRQHGGG